MHYTVIGFVAYTYVTGGWGRVGEGGEGRVGEGGEGLEEGLEEVTGVGNG